MEPSYSYELDQSNLLASVHRTLYAYQVINKSVRVYQTIKTPLRGRGHRFERGYTAWE